MAYTLKTKDQIEITNIPEDVPENSPALAALVKEQRAKKASGQSIGPINFPVSPAPAPTPAPAPAPAPAPTARSSGSLAVTPFSLMGQQEPSFVPQNTEESRLLQSGFRRKIEQIAPEVVRYGPPIAVGLATAPEAGVSGAALLGYAGLQSIYGGVSSAASEAAAQFIAGQPLDAGEIKAAAIRGGIFQVPGGAYGKGMLKELGRIVGNIGLGQGTEMAARKVQGKSVWGDSAFERYFPASASGVSSALSGYASRVGRLTEAGKKASEEFAEATPLLSQVSPEFIGLEGRVQSSRRGSMFINRLLEDLTVPLAKRIQDLYPENPEAYSRVMKEINPVVSTVEGYRASAAVAAQEAKRASAILDNEVLAGRTASRELIENTQRAQAQAEKARALYAKETQQILFGSSVPVAEDVTLATAQSHIAGLRQAVDTEKTRVFDNLYSKIGIKKDTKVGDVAELFAEIDASDLSIAEKNIARDQILEVLKPSGVTFAFDKAGNISGDITNQALVNMRNELRVVNTRRGLSADIAKKNEELVYNVISGHTDDYIGKNIGEQTEKLRKEINTKYAVLSEALESDLGVDVAKIKPEDFVARILSEKGKGSALANLAAYKNAIIQIDPTDKGLVALADRFEQQVHSVVKNSIISKHLNASVEGVSDFQRIDVAGLVGDLNALRNFGYPVEMLGLDPKKLRSLASITSLGLGQKDKVTYGEFQLFLKLLPEVGQNAAAAKTRAFSAVRELFRDSVLPIRKKTANLRAIARKANLTSEELSAATKAAEADPIYQLVTNSDQAKKLLSTTFSNNNEFSEALLNQSPETLRGLIKALNDKGRGDLVDEIRFVTQYTILRDLLKSNPAGAGIIDDKAFNKMFRAISPEDVTRVIAFNTIQGTAGLKALNDGILGQIKKIANTRGRVLGYKAGPTSESIRPFTSVKGIAEGKSPSQFMFTQSISAVYDFFNLQRYRLAHTLYADPVTSKMFSKVGYSLERISEQPVLAAAVRVANQKDEELIARQQQAAQ
jgi:hypothetical protein